MFDWLMYTRMRNFTRFGLAAGLSAAIAVLGIRCSSGPRIPCPGCIPCPQFEYYSPEVQELYPVPYSSAVPDQLGVVIYASTQSVPIVLQTGAASIATSPTALPSPLPSPAATPYSGFTEYAVSVTPLTAATTYAAVASVTEITGCGGHSPTQQQIATFTTR